MTSEKIVRVATYISETGCTVRQAASRFKVSKSTIHKDMTRDLKYIDSELYYQVKKVLEKNKIERNMRGGLATRERYYKIRESKKTKNDI